MTAQAITYTLHHSIHCVPASTRCFYICAAPDSHVLILQYCTQGTAQLAYGAAQLA